MVCVGLFDNGVCICTSCCSLVGLLFQAYSGLLVQGQRRSFEIGENGGPTLFTESFNRGALSGLPSRRDFLNLFRPLAVIANSTSRPRPPPPTRTKPSRCNGRRFR